MTNDLKMYELHLITGTGEIWGNIVITRIGQVNRGRGSNISDGLGQKKRMVVNLGLIVVACSIILIHISENSTLS